MAEDALLADFFSEVSALEHDADNDDGERPTQEPAAAVPAEGAAAGAEAGEAEGEEAAAQERQQGSRREEAVAPAARPLPPPTAGVIARAPQTAPAVVGVEAPPQPPAADAAAAYWASLGYAPPVQPAPYGYGVAPPPFAPPPFARPPPPFAPPPPLPHATQPAGGAPQLLTPTVLAGVKRALGSAGGGAAQPAAPPAPPRPTPQQVLAQQAQDPALAEDRQRRQYRAGPGERWVDPTLTDWPLNDHRIFVGNIGNEVTDEVLTRAFSKYPSFAKARVARDKSLEKSRGYGFVSFLDSADFAAALKDMNGKYVGNRPCMLRKCKPDEYQDTAPPPEDKRGGGGGGGKKRKRKPTHVPGLEGFTAHHN